MSRRRSVYGSVVAAVADPTHPQAEAPSVTAEVRVFWPAGTTDVELAAAMASAYQSALRQVSVQRMLQERAEPAFRNRVLGMCKMLEDEGHMTPMATRQLDKLLHGLDEPETQVQPGEPEESGPQ